MILSMMILDARYDLFNTPDESGATPLMLAASHGWDDLVMALLEGGARRGDLDMNGRSAEDYAEAREAPRPPQSKGQPGSEGTARGEVPLRKPRK